MAVYGMILINDVQGYKVKSAIKKFLSGGPQHSTVPVLQGELLVELHEKNDHFNYQLYRDSSICMFCTADDVAPLNFDEFYLLEPIKSPADTLHVFRNKLEWGLKLKQGSSVNVALTSHNLSVENRVRATVHYKGPIGNQAGVFFGVEVLKDKKSKLGTTDGTFQDKRYFTCEDGCGLFVSLRWLSPVDKTHKSKSTTDEKKHSYSSAVTGKPSPKIQSRSTESSVDPPPVYSIGQRVSFHDSHGGKHCGTVQWTGRSSATRTFDYTIAGIHTDDKIFNTDYDGSVPGFGYHMNSFPKNHVLFLPEALLDPLPTETSSASDANANFKKPEQESINASARNAKIAKDDQATIEALIASEESINIKQQQDAYRQFQADNDDGHQFSNLDRHTPSKPHDAYDAAGRRLNRVGSMDSKVSGNVSSNKERRVDHDYDEIPTPPTRRHLSQPNHLRDQAPESQTAPFTSRRRDADEHRGFGQPNSMQQDPVQNQPHQNHPTKGSYISQQGNFSQSSRDPMLASTGEPKDESSIDPTLVVGSLIQIPSNSSAVSWKYGTIKWIGQVPNVQGTIAGIELDEGMEGCTDGTFHGGRKYFDCPSGRGLYYPLRNLQPDARYAPEVAVDGNPLRDVSSEEPEVKVQLGIDQYVGERRGIQGHQNSCYMDATLFGLFALTTEFDDMFFRKPDSDPSSTTFVIGNILWKNIVNPLRKNGVVKFESVMKLRDELDKLGKMEGITQDEKDPEEFLNMMFKVILHVPPFISIKRPYGVENEYFVQLFLEMDESQKNPSIGELLNRMFAEQSISFTEVPSKLLIQVPRFGKKFQMFQKIIPAVTINVTKCVDLKNPLDCYICSKPAKEECVDCIGDYRTRNTPVSFCDSCMQISHAHPKRRHHKPQWCAELREISEYADLELLCVICIETSHYVCFSRQENRWIFFDSMANRVYDRYNIPKVEDCTSVLNEWVYPKSGDLTRLLKTPPRELPEYVRRFTQDIYMCVYIQHDISMYK